MSDSFDDESWRNGAQDMREWGLPRWQKSIGPTADGRCPLHRDPLIAGSRVSYRGEYAHYASTKILLNPTFCILAPLRNVYVPPVCKGERVQANQVLYCPSCREEAEFWEHAC